MLLEVFFGVFLVDSVDIFEFIGCDFATKKTPTVLGEFIGEDFLNGCSFGCRIHFNGKALLESVWDQIRLTDQKVLKDPEKNRSIWNVLFRFQGVVDLFHGG